MRLYKAEEAAEILRVSKQTVWKYGREGKLKAIRFGRTVRYDLEGNDEQAYQSNSDADSFSNVHRNGPVDGYSNRSIIGGEL